MQHPYIKKVLEVVRKRNHTEKVFLQAVEEVLITLAPIIETYPEFEELNILERISEPERQILFSVVWEDDKGKVHVNRGFRTNFNATLGPYKGGLRFHPSVNSGVIKFLAFEQIFKNSLTGLQIGGGKGGSDFDPKGKSDREVMRFCQSFMSALYRYIGARTDVPAGDIGVGSREIGYLFGQYKRLTNEYNLGVLTGKGEGLGGSMARKEATGFGAVYFAQEMLLNKGDALSGKNCVVSGSGNVALYAIKKLQLLGANVLACSDSGGYVHDPKGLDFETLKQIKEIDRNRIQVYVEKHPHATFKENTKVWEVPCDLAFPCATQNELHEEDAQQLVANGCFLVCEGANMPSTPEAIKYLRSNNVLFGPGKAANAGGVAVSALEMQQNAAWESWTFEEVDTKLRAIMEKIHKTCLYYAAEYSTPDDYISGANIGGFLRVARGMVHHGIH